MSDEIIDYIIKWVIGLTAYTILWITYLIWHYYKCEREIENYRKGFKLSNEQKEILNKVRNQS